MPRQSISTPLAPQPVGPYSQGVRGGDTGYLSGQIGLVPATGELVDGGIADEARQVFENLTAVCRAFDTTLGAILRIQIYLTDLDDFPLVNAMMSNYFCEPYPARTTVQVAALPLNARIEIDAIVALS